MSFTAPASLLAETKTAMSKAVDHMKSDFASLRTGRASASLVDGITVEAYGSQMRLKDVATISVPEARMVVIQPWDKGLLKLIEKAIMASNIGITPNCSDGQNLRLPIPELSEERRKKLSKDAKEMSEKARVAIRGTRRDANEAAKKFQKDALITEDDLKSELDAIQKATDDMIASVDKLLSDKEKELLTV